ncbi:MAG TPA: hypothetical protein VJ789_12295 [Burkholderiales bacterium]|nr:hypothetical protein [Burkholderiales bacterium]
MRTLLIALFAAASLAACGEKTPRADPERVPAYNVVNGAHPLAERTREQGESERLGH